MSQAATGRKLGQRGSNRDSVPTINAPQAPVESKTFALITRWPSAMRVLRRMGYPTQSRTKAATARLNMPRTWAGRPNRFTGSTSTSMTASVMPMMPRRLMNLWSASSVAYCCTSVAETV
jgi:hypothetical protein